MGKRFKHLHGDTFLKQGIRYLYPDSGAIPTKEVRPVIKKLPVWLRIRAAITLWVLQLFWKIKGTFERRKW